AEDGTRAFHVTGVRPCALPITRRRLAGNLETAEPKSRRGAAGSSHSNEACHCEAREAGRSNLAMPAEPVRSRACKRSVPDFALCWRYEIASTPRTLFGWGSA